MINIAISPCPNDTFLFYPWIKSYVGDIPITPHYYDIETLNHLALAQTFPLTKVSIAVLRKLKNYDLLPVGAAVGYGVGPKVVGLQKTSVPKIVAIPGKDTTAHLLFDHFFPGYEKIFCTYDQVLALVKEKKADIGVIIHETRFTFMCEGFFEIADLGALWGKKTSLPLPLGGLVLHKDYASKASQIISTLQSSYHYARTHPLDPLIFSLSQEKDPNIVKKHIDLYVTNETFELSDEGKKAINEIAHIC